MKLSKRVLSIVLALFVCFGCLPVISIAADDGTISHLTEVPEGYIGVFTVDDLYAVRNDLNANYILMNDIDLADATSTNGTHSFLGGGWEPIGSANGYKSIAFSGVFDGNGYEIRGMQISVAKPADVTSIVNIGLFSNISGEVKNLTMSNCRITSSVQMSSNTYLKVGFIAAVNSGVVKNCCIQDSNIFIDAGFRRIFGGGVIGVNSGTIFQCSNTGYVDIFAYDKGANATCYAYAGGIAGINDGGLIEQSFNEGDVKADAEGPGGFNSVGHHWSDPGVYYAGGITSRNGTIVNCYNSGDIDCYSYEYGIASSNSITNCYNVGSAYNAISNYTVENCYFISSVGNACKGSVACTEYQMKQQSTYKDFDYVDVWYIDSDSENPYPQFRWTFSKKCNHENTEWVVLESADCSNTGIKENKCVLCRTKFETRIIPATGHTEVVDEAVESTCTTPGKTEGKHCAVCGDILVKQSEIPASGHTHSGWIKGDDSTCTKTGYNYKECIVCNEILDTEILPALGHTVIKDDAVEPSCTSAGKTEGSHCVVCGEIIDEQKTVIATGHKVSGWIVDSTLSCETDEVKHVECIVCGDVLETKVVPATGHTTVIDPAVAATCTTAGKTEGSHCSVCNTVIIEQTTVDALGHTSSDWIIDVEATVTTEGSKHKECTVCGETLETATITQLKPATPKVKAVNTINGMKVTWNAVDGAVKYGIYKRLGTENTWTFVTTLTGTSYADNDAPLAGKYYVYTVKAYNSAGIASDYIRANCASVQRVVAPVTKAVNAINGVNVTWNKVAGASKYVVLRRIGTESTWKTICTTTSTSYIDKNVKSGTYYLYSIRAVNNTGYSAFDTKKTDTIQPITAPTAKVAKKSNGVQVSWNSVSGATKYNVYRRLGGTSTWVYVGTTTSATLLDKGVVKGKYYAYSIRAINGTGYSAYNSSKCASIKYS